MNRSQRLRRGFLVLLEHLCRLSCRIFPLVPISRARAFKVCYYCEAGMRTRGTRFAPSTHPPPES
jgi:hypothetical protein